MIVKLGSSQFRAMCTTHHCDLEGVGSDGTRFIVDEDGNIDLGAVVDCPAFYLLLESEIDAAQSKTEEVLSMAEQDVIADKHQCSQSWVLTAS